MLISKPKLGGPGNVSRGGGLCGGILLALVTVMASLLSSCTSTPKEEARFTVQVRKKWDRLEMKRDGGMTTWLVTSPGGIGGARVTLDQGTWPKKVRVRLQYESRRGFPRVEGFLYATDDGRRQEISDVEIEPNFAEVRIPHGILNGDVRFIDLEWADFFR